MQEHIRRAHPDHYIPKLPATEESFLLMVNTPPTHRPQPQPTSAPNHRGQSDTGDRDFYGADISSPPSPRIGEDAPPAAANAAVALAQLHQDQVGTEWDSEMDTFSEPQIKRERLGGSIELPSLRDQFRQDALTSHQANRPRELLPSILAHSPPGRYSSLPPIQRSAKLHRPRKSSVGQNARKAKHERTKSKEFSRRLSMEGRKAMSAEPPTAAWVQGKRWEDLIEAATSATEADDDRDLTPVPQSPNHQSTTNTEAVKRSSLPPGFRIPGQMQQQYHASPLQNALTPPPPVGLEANEPFPSVESSVESVISGQNFHISTSGLSASGSANNDTSPSQLQSHHYHHSQSSSLGSRSDSLEILSSPVITVQPGLAPVRRGCPRCGVMDGKWKRFQLDFR
ncbi:hypothetical protein EPUS_04753 [Endocarpon pusillum Z07020]|uniref:Transcription factor RfeD n=1 Tax=Endocarpon pusillum (strain Z07020 / HMAS-L-300199) TaxID=1263415 RepID=U1HJP7_ENDPU|nr:uncharacterized protein EPUS_04753 [Endocarpon pusillum Z07020]ERF70475.1 hypothetical protein EPUS_04753 [Endocarpon pusillum Z07020]